MSAWAIKDTAKTWQDVCDRAWAGEPQFVSCGPSQTVVVISCVDYHPVVSRRRRIVRNPKLAFRTTDADLFSDDSLDWEACNDQLAPA